MPIPFSPKINFQMHTEYSDNREHRTILEMARGARKAGFTHIAITDHLELIPETSVWKRYRQEINHANRTIKKLRVFTGIEVSMLEKRIDWAHFLDSDIVVVASCHDMRMSPKNTEHYVDMLLRTIRDKLVSILGHPLRILFEEHLRMFTEHETLRIIRAILAEEKKGHRIAVELNGGDEKRKLTKNPAYRTFYHHCNKAGLLFSMGSDAHTLADVSRLPYDLIAELAIPTERIFLPT